MLLIDYKDIKKIEEIYSSIISERVRIQYLRKVIYNFENPYDYFEKWFRLDNNKEKIEYFLGN